MYYSSPFSKLFAIYWLFSGIVFTAVYSGKLFLGMTELEPQNQLNSLNELAYAIKRGEYIPLVKNGSIYYQLFRV